MKGKLLLYFKNIISVKTYGNWSDALKEEGKSSYY